MEQRSSSLKRNKLICVIWALRYSFLTIPRIVFALKYRDPVLVSLPHSWPALDIANGLFAPSLVLKMVVLPWRKKTSLMMTKRYSSKRTALRLIQPQSQTQPYTEPSFRLRQVVSIETTNCSSSGYMWTLSGHISPPSISG